MTVLERLRARVLEPAPQARVAVLRTIVYLFVVYDTFFVVDDVYANADASQSLYRPLKMRTWLHLPTPNHTYVLVLHLLIIAGGLLCASGRLPRVAGGVAGLVVAAAFTDWVSISMSYSKINHDHFALIVAVWVLPTVGVARYRDRFRSEAAAWALLSIQIACVAIYFLSAWAKVRYGGWDWVTGSTFAWAVTRRGTALARPLLHVPWLLTLAQFGLFALELSTPTILFLRGKWRYAFVGLLFSFHIVTDVTIRINFLALVVCLLAFLPLEKLIPVAGQTWTRVRMASAMRSTASSIGTPLS